VPPRSFQDGSRPQRRATWTSRRNSPRSPSSSP
jgi:hypothetical protein